MDDQNDEQQEEQGTVDIVSVLYVVGGIPFMIFFPELSVKWITGGEHMVHAGIDFTRLFGAACFLILLLTWGGSNLKQREGRKLLAWCFFLYESLGFFVGLTVEWNTPFHLARIMTVGFYAFFAAGYAWFLFVAPGKIGGEPAPS